MEYSKNILPTDAVFYKLVDATIENEVLTVFAGGTAKYTFKKSDLSKMTEYIRVTLIPDNFTDNYNPRVRAKVHVVLESGEVYNYTLFPVFCHGGVYIQELKLKAGEYTSFTFEIESKDRVVFNLYELCPEAADNDIHTVIDGVEQSLPRLLYDYNVWPLTVSQQEKTIGMISYYLLDNTDLQGHLQLTYTASSNCVLTLRIKDTYVTELYAPLVYDLKAGSGSIGVPHAYLSRLQGNHNATVTAQVSAGYLYLDVRSLMYTIDGGYLAERVLDVPSNVRDISLKQLNAVEPSEIWIVGIDAGEVLVKSREYRPEKLKTTFTSQYSLGKGLQAAIEFNGYWMLPESADNYTIITEEEPYVFWVDENSVLWAQRGLDTTTLIQIDTDVSEVHACRGYKSERYLDKDQGLVCVYLKYGKVYYTQYLWDNSLQVNRWSNTTELDSTLPKVLSVSVGRLNDYRIQITVITETYVRCYITHRTYVNQAANPERAYIPGMSNQTTPMAYLPYDYAISLKCISTRLENDNKRLIAIFDGILELKWYHDIKYYIAFNESIPEYDSETGDPFVDSIKLVVNPVQKTTVITVDLNFEPLKPYTEMYLNESGAHSLWLKLDDYGYAVCPFVTAAWDTTNYINASFSERTLANIPVVYKSNIEYRSVTDLYTHQSEAGVVPADFDINMLCKELTNKIIQTDRDTAQVCVPALTTINYLAISDEPI